MKPLLLLPILAAVSACTTEPDGTRPAIPLAVSYTTQAAGHDVTAAYTTATGAAVAISRRPDSAK